MIRYFKSEPSEFVIHHAAGRVKHEGAGIAFFYFAPTASIAIVPITTVDTSFIFNEVTRSFQAISIQGQLTWRVRDPRRVAELLDFSVDPKKGRAYRSKDPDRLAQRVVNIVQRRTQAAVRALTLEEALLRAESVAREVLLGLPDEQDLADMGVECLSLHFLAVKPTPEIGKALEAELREALQRKADEAIYARRAAAVEQERKIKENELATETALEEQRRGLIALQAENAEKEAQFRAKVTAIELAPYSAVEPRMLMALAFRTLGANAEKIGNLAITPDLLTALMQAKG